MIASILPHRRSSSAVFPSDILPRITPLPSLALLALLLSDLSAAPPHAVSNPGSPVMLAGDWVPDNPHQIDYSKLPRLPGEHVVINSVREQDGVNQHNYLAHHNGLFYAMWSDGPAIEDRVGQRVKFATSKDGLAWGEPTYLTPVPPNSAPGSPHYNTRSDKGFRYIARGFWQRGGDLLALASLDEATGFFGKSLALHAFLLAPDGESWEDTGVIADNAINNFPPKQITSGEWMMSRRPYNYKSAGVDFLIGGVKSANDWQSYPVLGSSAGMKAEEPLWWTLPDGNLMALFRDNGGSKFLYRSFSTDKGRNWSTPVRTDFPDATSKIFGLRLSDGRYLLISNSNPRRRDPLTLAISGDGIVFTKLAYLMGGRHVDYPHAIEHHGHLFVAFAGGKQSVELLKIKLSDLDAAAMPISADSASPLPSIATPQSPAEEDWIDLGLDGGSLYLTTELTAPRLGQTTALSLITRSGKSRITIAIDKAGHLTARLHQHLVTGPKLTPGETVALLIKVIGHRDKPDELLVKSGIAGAIPPQPGDDPGWTLINRMGSSDANLSRAVQSGGSGTAGFSGVRVARSLDSLLHAQPVEVPISPTPPDRSPPRADPR